VEWVFGVLEARFAIVGYPAVTWSQEEMWEVIKCCVVLHNMIIESERKNQPMDDHPYYGQDPLAHLDNELPAYFTYFLAMYTKIQERVSMRSFRMILSSIYAG
jgi:hypothetical protein